VAAIAIEVDGLFKSYGQVDALRGVSFRVEEGEVFALLGPNGAGKTTTLEILEGYRRRSGGRVSVLGVDPELGGRALRERVGIVLQSAGIDGELAVGEVLSLYAGCYPHPLPVDDVVALVGLQEKHRARVKTLSGGQKRRLDLALALVGDPDLLFLDEQTTGFDPGARQGAWHLLQSLRALGRTIVLSSHYMDEVQHLADQAIVLTGGRIVAEGSPDALGAHTPNEALIRFRLPGEHGAGELPQALRHLVQARDGELVLRTVDPTRTLALLCSWAVDRDLDLRGLEVVRPSLEDVYLQLTEADRNGGG
jgi:ABC-2 type transport system ATP-binding protein